ncbi:MAG: ribonuclease M5 [Erysipelotrichales bacterium]
MLIKEVIVVEGKNDEACLKQFLDVDIITTNGSALSKETLSLIKEVNETRGVIIFSDPDYPGKKIRNTIIDYVGETKHAFLKKSKAIDPRKKKVGIEHATKEDILASLENVVTFGNENTITWEEYLKLGFVGSKANRQYICDKLNIGVCNGKTLFKRLNMLALSYDEVKRLMEED